MLSHRPPRMKAVPDTRDDVLAPYAGACPPPMALPFSIRWDLRGPLHRRAAGQGYRERIHPRRLLCGVLPTHRPVSRVRAVDPCPYRLGGDR